MSREIDVHHIRIGVIGGGSWGTALANLLAEKGYPIDLWVFEPEVRQQILEEGENRFYLPGIRLSKNIRPTNELSDAASGKDLIVLVTPSHHMREITGKLHSFIHPGMMLVSASKGIENKTHLTMTGIIREMLPQIPGERICVLSGPSFAREVASRLPTVVSVGSKSPETATVIQQVFATPLFRVYTNPDVIGLELGGAVKNVIAIAAGIVDGLKLGLDARAALITRGLAEMRRLGIRLGADPHTFAGLSGVGDLILTCTGDLSRNYTVGKQIGMGMTLDDILKDMRMVAEGVRTAKSIYNMSRKLDVVMPIVHEVYHTLYDGIPPKEAVYRLMTRDLKGELDF